MNVNGVQPLMPFKELLPKWRKWQPPFDQKHECNLLLLLLRQLLHFRRCCHRRRLHHLLDLFACPDLLQQHWMQPRLCRWQWQWRWRCSGDGAGGGGGGDGFQSLQWVECESL
uniref:Uncharacterized protein n=1 Tax=Opuntia streptacantha TaxID=393608 RepID=A0A7C9E123_OPUST